MQKEDFKRFVRFEDNTKLPIYNWFYYKEGFSKNLVEWGLKNFYSGGRVVDPFCGVGTTLLVCKERGIDSLGMDVLPIAVFSSRVKTRNYNIGKLKNKLEEIKKTKPEEIKKPRADWLRKVFYSRTLNDLCFYKKLLEEEKDEKVRDFFILALIKATGIVARVKKVGGSLRRVSKPKMPVRKIFLQKAAKMIKDLEKTRGNFSSKEPTTIQKDARKIGEFLEKEGFSLAVFSPPYLNKIEYTKVYKLENFLFFGKQETKIRSYLGEEPRQVVELEGVLEKYNKEAEIVKAYLKDINIFFGGLYKVLEKKGKAVCVVGGGCLPNKPFNVDCIFEEIARKNGFSVLKNIAARTILCHRDRTRKLGRVRENILVFEK